MYQARTGVWKGRAEGGREMLRRGLMAYRRASALPGSIGVRPLALGRRHPSIPTTDLAQVSLVADTER